MKSTIQTIQAETAKDLIAALTSLIDDDGTINYVLCHDHSCVRLELVETQLSDGSKVRDIYLSGK